MMYGIDHKTNIDIILKHIEVSNYIGYTRVFQLFWSLQEK